MTDPTDAYDIATDNIMFAENEHERPIAISFKTSRFWAAKLRCASCEYHATIFEVNVESYRRKTAVEKKRATGWPPTRSTLKSIAD